MGQAKRRGTFEERQAQAIARNQQVLKDYIAQRKGYIGQQTAETIGSLLADPDKLRAAIKKHERVSRAMVNVHAAKAAALSLALNKPGLLRSV